jgi:hypothetical protein
MVTPEDLIGRINPRTRRPYGRQIKESLGGPRNLVLARKARDLLLGKIRQEQAEAASEVQGSLEQALSITADMRTTEDSEAREIAEIGLMDQAEALEPKIGTERAVRWYRIATGKRLPFVKVCNQFKAGEPGKTLSQSSLNNLETAVREFLEFAGKDVCLEDLDHRLVKRFVTEFLPNKKGPKTPNGQGPATIRKKVSQLSRVWI